MSEFTKTESTFEENIEYLERDGFILIPNALDEETVLKWRDCLYAKRERDEYDGFNSVGNMYFEKLLIEEEELSHPLVGHPSVAPYLKAILGKQCQLRSLRAHLNPSEYTQEWHMDFRDYWYQMEKTGGSKTVQGFCMNTTFYLTDNTPDTGRLTFIKEFCHKPIPEEMIGHLGYTDDRSNPFQRWCDEQPHVDLHPMSGDAVIFYSHIPHQGAKTGEDKDELIRANLVLHYQQNPMYPGIIFVSRPDITLEALGYDATFPFAEAE